MPSAATCRSEVDVVEPTGSEIQVLRRTPAATRSSRVFRERHAFEARREDPARRRAEAHASLRRETGQRLTA